MSRKYNILNAPEGFEQLKAVRFPDLDSHYLSADVTGTWFNDTWTSRTYELYIKNRGVGTTQMIWHGALSPSVNTLYIAVYLLNSNRIRMAYFRSGTFFYRRDYPFPADGNAHHVLLSHKTSGGSTRESCYIDGVGINAVSSAYLASTQLVPGSQWLFLGKRSAITSQPLESDLCYIAQYRNTYIPPFNAGGLSIATNYYNQRANLDARRATKPVFLGIDKPEVFFCANDILDLSIGWTDSNYGTSLTSYALNNSDIVTF